MVLGISFPMEFTSHQKKFFQLAGKSQNYSYNGKFLVIIRGIGKGKKTPIWQS